MFQFKLSAIRMVIRLQCVTLALTHRFLFRRSLRGDPENILLYRTGRLGDFVNAIPAMRVIRNRFPKARITLLTTSSTMKSMQAVTSRYVADPEKLPWLRFVTPSIVDDACVFSMRSTVAALRQVRRYVKRRRPDCVFLLPFAGEGFRGRMKKLALLRLAGARGPIYGWRMTWSRSFMPHAQFRAMRAFEHQVVATINAVAECPTIPPVRPMEISFELAIPEQDRLWMSAKLERLGWTSERVVAVIPGAPFEHKRWPIENYIRLCRELRAKWSTKFVVLAIKADELLARRLCESLGADALNLAGQTSITQMAAVFERCVLCVGNDSGPGHVASAVGCPCVTVMSAMDFPGYWDPWNSPDLVVRHSVPCEFCLSAERCPLGTNACIEGIPADEVLQKCEAVLRAVGEAAIELKEVS